MNAFDDPTWRAVNNGAGPRIYGVARFAGREWAQDADGRYRRFGNRTAAQRLADQLNAAEVAAQGTLLREDPKGLRPKASGPVGAADAPDQLLDTPPHNHTPNSPETA